MGVCERGTGLPDIRSTSAPQSKRDPTKINHCWCVEEGAKPCAEVRSTEAEVYLCERKDHGN